MLAIVIIVNKAIIIIHILSIRIIAFITLNFVLMLFYFCCYINVGDMLFWVAIGNCAPELPFGLFHLRKAVRGRSLRYIRILPSDVAIITTPFLSPLLSYSQVQVAPFDMRMPAF